jgi:hypothetical protein
MVTKRNPGWAIFLTKHSVSQMDVGRCSIVEGSDELVDGSSGGLSHQMLAILEKANGNDIDLGTIIAAFSRNSHAVLIVFLSFPLCLPVGIPVLSTTLGLTLGLVGFLLAMGREIWIPKSIAAKVIPYKRLSYLIERLLRVSERMERWFHPRALFFASNGAMIRIHGMFTMLLGLTGWQRAADLAVMRVIAWFLWMGWEAIMFSTHFLPIIHSPKTIGLTWKFWLNATAATLVNERVRQDALIVGIIVSILINA